MGPPPLLDVAVGVATGIVSGRYKSNDHALRAIARHARGHTGVERQVALDAALQLVRTAMARFEELNPPLGYNPQLSQVLLERLARDFPQFSLEARREAVIWCDIWFCK